MGLAARNHGVDMDNHPALEVLAGHLDVQFTPDADGNEIRQDSADGPITVCEGACARLVHEVDHAFHPRQEELADVIR